MILRFLGRLVKTVELLDSDSLKDSLACLECEDTVSKTSAAVWSFDDCQIWPQSCNANAYDRKNFIRVIGVFLAFSVRERFGSVAI